MEGLPSFRLDTLRLLLDENFPKLADDALIHANHDVSSPEAVLRSVRGLPHPSAAAVDHPEAAITAARLLMRE